MSESLENNYAPFQVAMHYMHKLLTDPSRVLAEVHSPEQAADLILSTLDSYQLPHYLTKEIIIGAIPKKRFRKGKEIKWEFFQGTPQHIEIVIEDCRQYHIQRKYVAEK